MKGNPALDLGYSPKVFFPDKTSGFSPASMMEIYLICRPNLLDMMHLLVIDEL
jgi:hypothetical protein